MSDEQEEVVVEQEVVAEEGAAAAGTLTCPILLPRPRAALSENGQSAFVST